MWRFTCANLYKFVVTGGPEGFHCLMRQHVRFTIFLIVILFDVLLQIINLDSCFIYTRYLCSQLVVLMKPVIIIKFL